LWFLKRQEDHQHLAVAALQSGDGQAMIFIAVKKIMARIYLC
jgi:hypothetical protein